MFEFVDGRRKLTRYGQTLFVIVFLVIAAIGAAVYMSTHKTDGQDNSGDIKAVLGLVATVAGIIWINAKVQRIEDINHRQSEKLERIDGKVEVREENSAAIVRETYQAAMDALVKEHERERHQLKGRLGVFEGALKHVEGELMAVRESKAALESQVNSLTERLAGKGVVGEPGPQGERGERGERGDRGDRGETGDTL